MRTSVPRKLGLPKRSSKMLGRAVLAVVHTYVRTNTSTRTKVLVGFIIRTVSLREVAKLINYYLGLPLLSIPTKTKEQKILLV